MEPRTLVKNVQVVTLVVIILTTVLKTAECQERDRYINTYNMVFAPEWRSPNYPNLYPDNYYGTWKFETPPNCTLRLTFSNFELEASKNCTRDYVALYDGNTTADPLLGKFCGTERPPFIKSTANRMLMVFYSDGKNSYAGFNAVHITECHYSIKTYNIVNTPEVTSPNFPIFYPANYDIAWKFETTPNCTIRLMFHNFSLHYSCRDYVGVYDKNTSANPVYRYFCSKEIPPDVISTAHRMLMIFHSDDSVFEKGFRATYSTECHYSIKTYNSVNTSEVTSPNYPNSYPNNYHCIWSFETIPSCAFKLRFDLFKLQSSTNCSHDYVALYDGRATSNPLLGKFCGSEIPPDIISTAHRMLMVFHSDLENSYAGFRATYSTECNAKIILTDGTERNLTQYFLSTRKHTLTVSKWGTDITITALALYLNDPGFFAPGNETGEEITYELTLQLLSKLALKKRISTTDLVLFVNAMTVACINPKDFFGVNIVAELRKRIDTSNPTNPFFMLTLCNAREYMKMEDVDKLRQLFDTHIRSSKTEIQALVVMALKCISKQSDRNLNTTLNKMVLELERKQQLNGTVDNLKVTALVVQALIATEIDQTDFNMTLAFLSILKELKNAHVGIEELFYILPIFKGKTLLDINSNHCDNMIKTDLEEVMKLRKDPDERIQVQISVIIGTEMDFSRTWRIKVPSNFLFYQALENINSTERDYKFHYITSDGKPYVAGIGSFQNSARYDSFWFIYTKALSSADDPELVEKSPVDIHMNETHELILWYRSGPLLHTQKVSSNASS